MRISDWSSDVCSSDLPFDREVELLPRLLQQLHRVGVADAFERRVDEPFQPRDRVLLHALRNEFHVVRALVQHRAEQVLEELLGHARVLGQVSERSEEHTSELQSLMRISYAVFCLKKKNKKK